MQNHLIKKALPLVLISYLIVSCGTFRKGTDADVSTHPTTRATLWVQNSAEYQAITSQIYQTAISNLSLAKEDSYWSAALEQEDDSPGLPPAVILDVDETVLDNSAFQARMIKRNSDFSPEQWNDWVSEAKADAVAGALEFTQIADKQGITIFYVTNREASVEEGTRKNLEKLGFPLSPGRDIILSKNERDNWTSDKVNRRTSIAKDYRILMLFGDDLNDFLPAKDISEEKREQLVRQHQRKWGRQWYILPNPVYGSWEQALYNFDNSLTDREKEQIRTQKLDTKN